MVAQTIELPNIHKLFIPDPGHFIAEADLSSAEAQVVAWEAGDQDLMEAFKAGLNVHIKNARDVFPERVKGWSDEAIKATDKPGGVYYITKRCVHGTHNGGKPPGMAAQIGITAGEVSRFQANWFELHPKIKARQQYILDCLRGAIEDNPARTIFNPWGYRTVYFDRIDQCFTKALTWVQQSTVGVCTFKGALAMRRETPWAKLLLQVHDSLVFQFPFSHKARIGEIGKALHSVIIPYTDREPLCIPWKLNVSRVNWGEAKGIGWADMPR